MEEDDKGGPAKCRVLVVDDHRAVRQAIKELVLEEGDLEVCGEAEDMAEAMRLLREAAPDLVLVDLLLKDGHGLDLVRRILAERAETKILVLSVDNEPTLAAQAVRAGAQGYVAKKDAADKLVQAIHRVLGPETRCGILGPGRPDAGDLLGNLSEQERSVFERIAQGLTAEQMAARLGLDAESIELQRKRIREKLGLENNSQLIDRAIRWMIENG